MRVLSASANGERVMPDPTPPVPAATLGYALPREMSRVRELIPMYESIGPAGGFAVLMMKRALDVAQKALAEGDVVAMIRAHEDLKGFHE